MYLTTHFPWEQFILSLDIEKSIEFEYVNIYYTRPNPNSLSWVNGNTVIFAEEAKTRNMYFATARIVFPSDWSFLLQLIYPYILHIRTFIICCINASTQTMYFQLLESLINKQRDVKWTSEQLTFCVKWLYGWSQRSTTLACVYLVRPLYLARVVNIMICKQHVAYRHKISYYDCVLKKIFRLTRYAQGRTATVVGMRVSFVNGRVYILCKNSIRKKYIISLFLPANQFSYTFFIQSPMHSKQRIRVFLLQL